MIYIAVCGVISICLWTVMAEIPLDDFYPYGSTAGDVAMPKNDDGSSPDIPISTMFPFFDHQHSKLIVNTNGAISFLQTLSQFTPSAFPLDMDRRLVTAYWGDVDTTNGGTVWYRESTDPAILRRASEEIQKYQPKFVRFQATWALIATWDKVAFFGCSGQGCTKRNTFQTILLTNGQHSFTIFLYNTIVWTTGKASNGNIYTGLGGTPAQVGFNAGDGKVFYTVEASRTDNIVNINQMSNVGVPGKFIFRIDSAEIDAGGCNSKGSLTITPRYGPMLGGQLLTIGGPCIEEKDTITIVFDEDENDIETCEPRNEFSATCVTPMFMKTGDISVVLKINRASSGDTDMFTGVYTIMNPAVTVPKIKRQPSKAWKSDQNYTIEWKKTEMELDDGQLTIEVFTLMLLKGEFVWRSESLKTIDSKDIEKTTIFFKSTGRATAIKLGVMNRSSNKKRHRRGIWSDIFPNVPQNPRMSSAICSHFERYERRLNEEVPISTQPCPMTIEQAHLDTARFSLDPECNDLNGKYHSRNCIYRKDAIHCVHLNRIGLNGTDNLCCYDQEGNLIDSRNKEGGFVQKYHYQGGQGNVPYLSNMLFDTIPFLHCCRYSESKMESCKSFFARRKPNTAHNYAPPRPARASGDPHLTTLDGLNYTFNGVGEFQLLQDINKTLSVQIRFEQVKDSNGNPVQASVTTGIAMTIVNTTDTVEVRLNPIRVADVLVNGQLLEVEDDDVSYLQFKGVTVTYNSNDTSGRPKKEVTVAIPIQQISIRIQATHNVMNVMPVVADDSLRGSLRGLLGNFDGDPFNDLIDKSGYTIPASESTKNIHSKFGNTWRISESESLFTYPPGQSYSTMQNPSFEPIFDVPTNIPSDVSAVCGNDMDCVFDYQLTKSKEFAEDTLSFSQTFESAAIVAEEEIQTCVALPDIRNGTWNSSYSQLEGSKAIVVCHQEEEMTFETIEIICQNGNWTPIVDYENICLESPDATTVDKPHSAAVCSQCKELMNLIYSLLFLLFTF